MIITGLWLQNFRSIDDHHWHFDSGLNLFVAPNGSGKSNLIEAVRLLSTGRSWRTNQTKELIHWGEELARLKAQVLKQPVDEDTSFDDEASAAISTNKENDQNQKNGLDRGEVVELEQTLTVGEVAGRRAAGRLYKLNGVGKRRADVIGELATVVFTPEDMLVFQIGPAARRELLNNLLIQTDREYDRHLRQYEQVLRRRNKLIQQLKEGGVTRYDFFYWDQQLIDSGQYLQQARQQFLTWLEKQTGISEDYRIIYDNSEISEARLRRYANQEVRAGHTLVGPHKDDWQILVKRSDQWRDIGVYGSRGEQRLSLLWFKLKEADYLFNRHQDKPVLLLDDVFSELDDQNYQLLLDHADDRQMIITTVPGQEVLPEFAKSLF